MKTKIILADDHKLMREGLRSLLMEQPDMFVLEEVEDGRSAVEAAARLSPDLVIMDISMPGMNGIEATRQITAAESVIKVIALSMHLERRMVLEMLGAGATGYLLKDCAFDEVVQAVHTVASGNTYLSPRIADIVRKECIQKPPKADAIPGTALSGREREVLQLLAEGKKTREIASELNLSAKTVETYRLQIMEKLNMHSIAELTKYAVREGITPL